MKTVLVYTSNVLPWSETFIKEQILALNAWRGVLVGMRQAHQLPLDGVDIAMLSGESPSVLERVRWRLHHSTGTAPRFAVARLKKENPSILHAHFGVEAVKAWPIAEALDIPMIVTLHGYDININREWWEAGHGGRVMRKYPRRLMELAARPRVTFVAVSEAIRQRAISFGIPAGKVVVSHIGVDTTKFAPHGRPIGERPPRVLFVGRLVEKKGCEYLIQALAELKRRAPEARLVVIGDGPLHDPLRRRAEELGVASEFLGAQPASRVAQELGRARVLCLPSVTARNGDAEGFGLVLLEAQASGVPVVTSALGGVTEGIREGVTGFGFRERDVDGLAAHLAQLLINDTLANAFSVAGPAFVSKHFSLPHCTARLEALYDETSLGGRSCKTGA